MRLAGAFICYELSFSRQLARLEPFQATAITSDKLEPFKADKRLAGAFLGGQLEPFYADSQSLSRRLTKVFLGGQLEPYFPLVAVAFVCNQKNVLQTSKRAFCEQLHGAFEVETYMKPLWANTRNIQWRLEGTSVINQQEPPQATTT